MSTIRKVLCPVDLSPVSARQVELAAEVCRRFDARLVVHHNVAAAVAGVGVGWMWQGEHGDRPSPSEAEDRLGELIDSVAGVEVEGRLTRGLASTSVLATAHEVGADLVVVTTHDLSPEVHTSVTEQILQEGTCAVLALHEPQVEGENPWRLGTVETQRVLVATDLTRESLAAVDLAVELARSAPIELHLLHVAPGGHAAASDGPTLEERLLGLLPPDLAASATVHVEEGDPVARIVALAGDLAAAWIVMGEHTRHGWRRWLSRDTSRAVLHRAPCPVWYVPEAT